jgi:hypothetical protein
LRAKGGGGGGGGGDCTLGLAWDGAVMMPLQHVYCFFLNTETPCETSFGGGAHQIKKHKWRRNTAQSEL